ncbi:Uncharacterised protein [BD1-7 clade bacterium]|uniref:Uncharacterized protein n=1 Tax=BD1-7 clade bacterium TaxID=2029982 RepID=A0A5S9PWZ7_9GAMM|nr:Uncharacterised protein [BD1-7 clade bacterium]CAA0113067.1 Uncharacterised protein [BD1-7 clade bacterium]
MSKQNTTNKIFAMMSALFILVVLDITGCARMEKCPRDYIYQDAKFENTTSADVVINISTYSHLTESEFMNGDHQYTFNISAELEHDLNIKKTPDFYLNGEKNRDCHTEHHYQKLYFDAQDIQAYTICEMNEAPEIKYSNQFAYQINLPSEVCAEPWHDAEALQIEEDTTEAE